MEATYDSQLVETPSAWGAVICLSLLTFVLVVSEFMPVSLLTPLARDLAITEGQAGQAISVSGFFAVVTSLFGNALLSKLDRRTVVLLYTVVLVVSGLAITFAPTYPVFMFGRALIGVSIGGFWSLSTAILARIVSRDDLPRAIAMLQGGTAFATVVAAPLGSFLGGLIGWRSAFFIVVPIGLTAIVWQLAVLPSMPAEDPVSAGRMVGLLGNRAFAIGMAATTLAFMGQFSLSTYLRPFLEGITGLDVNTLSMVLLGLGLAGLVGTSLVGFVLRSHLGAVLIGLPAMLSVIALLLIALGPVAVAAAVLLLLWGLFTSPIPVAWSTWMAKVIPDDLEAGGGLQVALIQFAITFGAFAGGLLFDTAGWWSPFALAALLLLGSTLFAVAAATSTPTSRQS
ncbi:MFS transporter [Mesorhizobium sp. CO1-1-7]|uniref:MFS transporter n=1 Tax=unclassified Mesorhizobium TaxID=325217 RepID=UPI00112E89EB|nr:MULTISPECIES: MFS transporter [unclassified Mesorhizobium]MBZ9745873.1 MFS transporter [Mesorhizobium sp. CO1-1-7]TPK78841.1 MFS transporter [Mesorhizobium sp. B2-4-18]